MGNITLDRILYVERIPALDDVGYVERSLTCLGGRGALPAMIASALGARVALCTVMGGGAAAELLEPLIESGVDLTGVARDGTSAPLFEVLVVIGRAEENCISFFVPSAVEFAVNDAQRALARTARVLYLSTHKRSFNRALLETEPAGERTVVHNIGGYLFQDREYLALALERSHVLVGNEGEVADLLAREDRTIEALLDRGGTLRALVRTLGPQGVEVFERGQPPVSLEALPARVKTPVGAGDALAGGLLYGLAVGRTLVDAARFGLAAAAESIESELSYPEISLLRQRVLDRLEGLRSP